MPILEPASDDGEIMQGDLLVDLTTTTPMHGAQSVSITDRVLVVSRNGVAAGAEFIVAARVVERPITEVKAATSVSSLVRFFRKLRSGDGAPDTFYLGALNGDASKRYSAKFNLLHTIGIPTDPAARSEFIKKHRTHRLAPDYVRDMQLRLFRAFASMGFDDDGWWEEEDLAFVRRQDELELQAAEQELRIPQAERGRAALADVPRKLQDIDKRIDAAEKHVENVRREISRLLPSDSSP